MASLAVATPCHPLLPHPTISPRRFPSLQSLNLTQTSTRISAFPLDSGNFLGDPRHWSRISSFVVQDFGIGEGDDYEDDDDDDDEEDRSLDLLVRFVENVFRKISKKARKAVRSVLPLSISTQLVKFSVNGTIILAFLWISKAFLEVVCTLGSVVFVSILVIRGIWSWITYFQEFRHHPRNEIEDGPPHAWTGAQPVG